MPSMRSLVRDNATEALSFEPVSGVDGEGAPSYGGAVSFAGRTVQVSEWRRTENDDGQDTRVTLAVYADAEESFPEKGARLTAGGATYIVERVVELKDSRNRVLAQRADCRDE